MKINVFEMHLNLCVWQQQYSFVLWWEEKQTRTFIRVITIKQEIEVAYTSTTNSTSFGYVVYVVSSDIDSFSQIKYELKLRWHKWKKDLMHQIISYHPRLQAHTRCSFWFICINHLWQMWIDCTLKIQCHLYANNNKCIQLTTKNWLQ